MVHGIVNGHEGAVTVESEPYKGTRAHVFLPDAEPAAVTEPALLDTLQRGNERILLVDDEPSVIQMGRHTIERLGYTVTTASSSTRNIGDVQERPCDLRYVYARDDRKGLGAGTHGSPPDIPIILCTGFSEFISED